IAEVHSGAAEVGQGLQTVLVQIARTELGIDEVVLHAADTGVGSAGSSSASRQTLMSGGAVQLACRSALAELFERVRARAAARGSALPEGAMSVEDGVVLADGTSVGLLEDFLDEPIVRTEVFHHRPTQPFDADGQGDIHVMFAFAA